MAGEEMAIFEATTATPEVTAAVTRLVPQLSASSRPPADAQLAAMLAAPGTTLFLARSGERIVGMLTLVTFRIPTGLRAWIEDVVVDQVARGCGAGEALTRAALDKARVVGATTVDLSSRPSRAAANRLYVRLGFELRETNVYRRSLRTAPGSRTRAPAAPGSNG